MLKNIKSLAPLLDRVLVQRMKAETKTSTGIFLPDSAVKELNEGKVLAVGPGLHDKDGKRIPLGVQTGDKVLIPQFGGSPIKVGEEEFTLFRDHEYVARADPHKDTMEYQSHQHDAHRLLAKINE